MYEDSCNIINQGLNELKKTKNNEYYLLYLLLAKAKFKIGDKTESEKIIKLILEENDQIKQLIESDSELKQFLS